MWRQAARAGGLLLLAATAAAAEPPPPPRPATLQPAVASRPVCGLDGIIGQPVPDRSEQGGCQLANAALIETIDGVALDPPAEMTCETARTLAGWLAASALPVLAGQGGGLAGLEVAGAYVCRTRNNQPGGKLSEHAFGRAVDIAAFRLRDGSSIAVTPGGGGAATVARLRAKACGPFTSVLGPGADGFHQDHLHLDIARRSRNYCR